MRYAQNGGVYIVVREANPTSAFFELACKETDIKDVYTGPDRYGFGTRYYIRILDEQGYDKSYEMTEKEHKMVKDLYLSLQTPPIARPVRSAIGDLELDE